MKASDVWCNPYLCWECEYFREEAHEMKTGHWPRYERWCVKAEDHDDCPYAPEYEDIDDDSYNE